MTAGNGHDTGPGRPVMHRTKGLKYAVNALGNRAIDRRTTVGRALAAWRFELLADLGGIEAVSRQELARVEEAVKTKLIFDSVDACLLTQPSLIAKRTRGVLPAVRDRQALVATLRGLLNDLGFEAAGGGDAIAGPVSGHARHERRNRAEGDDHHDERSKAATKGAP